MRCKEIRNDKKKEDELGMKCKTLIILGGGLSGLAAGEILSSKFKTMIFEGAPFLGGLAANFEVKGKMIPRYYHHIIKSNKTTQRYLWKFGKVRSLRWKRIRVAIGIDSKIFNINEPLGLLKFKHLNFYEKIRFGLFGIYTLFLMNPNKINEEVDAETWLNRYVGKSVTKKIFYHLYSRNKFNIPLSKISAKQFANRLHEKEIYDYFAFPKEGYQSMIDGLTESIKENQGKIIINSKISEVNLKEKYVIESGKKIKYDLLISSLPSEEFLKMTKQGTGLPSLLKSNLKKVRYCPAVGLCFATESFLDKKNYWINLFEERVQIIMQHSLLNDTYKDKINWCLRYGGSEEDLYLSDEKIKQEYLKVIKKYFPEAKIIWAKVMRTKYGEPIYDIEYQKYMPPYKTEFQGLYFTGIQLTYPKIRNMNAALESGEKIAQIILKDYPKD